MKQEILETAKILRARARRLAQRPAAAEEAGSRLELLEFRLAQERYAIETHHVQEVQPLRDLTPLPATPAFVRGIVNLRGRILPVLDLKKFFDLPEAGIADLHQIVFVREADVELGLLVDVTAGVRSVAIRHLQPPLPTLTGIRAEYLRGVTDEPLIVLDLARMLSDPKIIVDESVEGIS
jgi:purine-binding chemotaxis protein CheW